MKRITLLLLIALTISCSKDEKNEKTQNTSNDLIIGSWQFGDVVDTFNDGTVNVISATQCDLQSSFTFEVDNDILLTSFIEDVNDNCVREANNLEYFRWYNNGNGNYLFESKEIDGTESNKTQNITFDNNVMIITEVTSNKTRKQYFNKT